MVEEKKCGARSGQESTFRKEGQSEVTRAQSTDELEELSGFLAEEAPISQRTRPAEKGKGKTVEAKGNTEAKEDWEAKEHSRRQRMKMRKTRRRSIGRTVVRMMMSEEEQPNMEAGGSH